MPRYEFHDATEGASDKIPNVKFGDCVCRAMSKAMNKNFTDMIYELAVYAPNHLKRGMTDSQYGTFLRKKGWKHTRCRPPITFGKLPKTGAVLVELKDHMTCVVNNVVYDDDDYRRYAVVGYWTKKG